MSFDAVTPSSIPSPRPQPPAPPSPPHHRSTRAERLAGVKLLLAAPASTYVSVYRSAGGYILASSYGGLAHRGGDITVATAAILALDLDLLRNHQQRVAMARSLATALLRDSTRMRHAAALPDTLAGCKPPDSIAGHNARCLMRAGVAFSNELHVMVLDDEQPVVEATGRDSECRVLTDRELYTLLANLNLTNSWAVRLDRIENLDGSTSFVVSADEDVVGGASEDDEFDGIPLLPHAPVARQPRRAAFTAAQQALGGASSTAPAVGQPRLRRRSGAAAAGSPPEAAAAAAPGRAWRCAHATK